MRQHARSITEIMSRRNGAGKRIASATSRRSETRRRGDSSRGRGAQDPGSLPSPGHNRSHLDRPDAGSTSSAPEE